MSEPPTIPSEPPRKTDAAGEKSATVHAQHENNDMSEIDRSIGRLEERLAKVPSSARMFWSAFSGAGAITAIVVAVMTVWIPREFDNVKSDIADMHQAEEKMLGQVSSDIEKLKGSLETANEGIQSLSNNVAAIGLSQRAQSARLLPMLELVETLDKKDLLRFAAFKGDRKAMADTVSSLPPGERDQLFTFMAVNFLVEALNYPPQARPVREK